MCIAENVYGMSDNTLLLEKGHILDDLDITRLSYYSVVSVLIEENIDFEPGSDAPSYSELLMQRKEFKQFKDDFDGCVFSFKTMINEIIEKDEKVQIPELVSPLFDLFLEAPNVHDLFAMIHLLRLYDDATYVHCINVGLISLVLGKWMKMSDSDLEILTASGMLHDIGKMRISDKIITKPDKLTDEEYEEVKKHPIIGYNILKNLSMNDHIQNAALMHHERYDGSGYPYKLVGNEIDEFAGIVAVADVYDAMTSARVYRGPLCPFTALKIFEEEGLQKYNPDAIITFCKNVVETYRQTKLQLSDGRVGDIVYINPNRYSRPTVKCGDDYVDLMENPKLEIVAIR
jgi:putative nucleotidyltransferase with HDIG domain